MKLQRKKVIYLCLGLLVLIILAVIGISLTVGSTPKAAEVRIPHGATGRQLVDTLQKAYGEDYTRKLLSTARAAGVKLNEYPGRYVFPAHTSRLMVVLKIAGRRQTPVRLTINNLRTRADITRAVAAHCEFTAAKLDSILNDEKTMAAYGLTPADANALFLNNTFEIWWTDTPQRLVKRLGDAYNRFWTDTRRRQAQQLGLTPSQVIIIASIAEEESARAEERGRIGRLYINRLQKDMRLQADPTVRFAINDFTVRRIGRQMLQAESPYNTYRVAGLPPGPIRTVEPATIDAILQSAPSDDLYMCARADFSGYHDFASDYATHQRNALEYRRALDQRGVK